MADDDAAVAVDEGAQATIEAETFSALATGTDAAPDEPPSLEDQLVTATQTLETVTKERNDLRSQTIGRQRAADRDAALHDEIGALSRSVSAMLKHVASGELDTAPLQEELDAIDKDSAAASVNRHWEMNYQQATLMLSEAVTDNGTRILDPTGPELQETRDAWNKARQEKSPEGLFMAVHLANQARLKFERSKTEEKAAPDAKDRLEMASAPSGGSSPQQMNNEDLWRAYGRGEVSFTENVKQAGLELGRL